MKASFLLENVNKKLPLIGKVVSGRSDLPILSSLLIEAGKGKITISATDLETGIIISLPASVEEEGRVVTPSKTFIELVSNITEDKIFIETDGLRLSLKTDRVKTVFQTSPAEDFPQLLTEKGDKWLSMGREELERQIKKVVVAASFEGDRPALSGVLVKKTKKERLLVATDGYRLSLYTKKEEGGQEQQMLISAKLLRDQIGIKEGGLDIFFSAKNNQIVFQREDILMVGRLIEAQFPEYGKIIPADSSTKATFERRQMLQAVKTCAIFARETSNIIKFSIKKDMITVSANAPTLGEGAVDVAAEVNGEENEIAFNARYLLDILGNVDEDEMILEMTTPTAPGVFKIVGDDSFLHLIMPIRVQE